MSTSIHNFHGDPLSLDDTRFFFIFCPNNSGTTVFSQYLTAQLDGYLPPFGNHEGQMMPQLRDVMRQMPWKKTTVFDWEFIRAQWETLVSDEIFIEASPPNMLRVDQIEQVFGHDSSAFISICNPYQHVASSMRRYALKPDKFARDWIYKAKQIRKLRRTYPHFPFVPYERFVRNPQVINKKLGVPVQDAKVKGKHGSGIDGISSSFVRSIGFFNEADVAAVTRELETAPGLMSYFGYDLAGPDFLDAARENSPEEFNVGMARRRLWERHQAKARSAAEGGGIRSILSWGRRRG